MKLTEKTRQELRETLKVAETNHAALQRLGWVARYKLENKLHRLNAEELMTLCAPLPPALRDSFQKRWVNRSLIGMLFGEAKPKPVCSHCNDTHRMLLEEQGREVMCTHCPTPCQACRKDGNGAYCAEAQCPCACHVLKVPR